VVDWRVNATEKGNPTGPKPRQTGSFGRQTAIPGESKYTQQQALGERDFGKKKCNVIDTGVPRTVLCVVIALPCTCAGSPNKNAMVKREDDETGTKKRSKRSDYNLSTQPHNKSYGSRKQHNSYSRDFKSVNQSQLSVSVVKKVELTKKWTFLGGSS